MGIRPYRNVVRTELGTSNNPKRGDGLARIRVGSGVDSVTGTPLGRREDAPGAAVPSSDLVRKCDSRS
jgi:hypothetical protein